MDSDLTSFESDIRHLLKEIDDDIKIKFRQRKRIKKILLRIKSNKNKKDKKGQMFITNF